MHMWYWFRNPSAYMPYGGIVMMVFGALLIALIVYLAVRNDRPANQKEDPLDILKRRFAEGAITEEDFVRMKRELAG